MTPRIGMLVRGLVLVQILAGTEADIQPVRWWQSTPALSVLRLTPDQSVAIERFYQDSQPAQCHASEKVFELTNQIDARIRDGNYDDKLLRLTERLAMALSAQREVRQRTQELAAHTLSAKQLETLNTMVPQQGGR